MEAVLFLALIVGAYFLWNKVSSAATTKANQQVFGRNAHRKGRELVSQQLQFQVKADPSEVKRAILSTVEAPALSAIIPNAHLIEVTDSYILYGYGTKLMPHNFRGLLTFEGADGGTRGTWTFLDWTEGDGIVAGISVMQRLVADVNAALRSVDANAVIVKVPVGNASNR